MCSVYMFSPVVKYLTSSTRVHQVVQRDFRNKPFSGLATNGIERNSSKENGFWSAPLYITSERIINLWFGKMIDRECEFITLTLTSRQGCLYHWLIFKFVLLALYSFLANIGYRCIQMHMYVKSFHDTEVRYILNGGNQILSNIQTCDFI